MVREARFSWDDTDDFDPTRHALDDGDFDDIPDLPEIGRSRRGGSRGTRKRRRPSRRPDEGDPPRHLADADWLDRMDPDHGNAPVDGS